MNLFHRVTGDGPPLLILHGLFGSSDNWQTHARVFAQSHTVYLIDQRNHGHSPHEHGMDYDVLANDLFELVANLGLRDVRLIGHSMGGKTIMRFAQQYSFLIDKMVVADMGVKAYPPHHDEVFKGLFAVDVLHCASRKEAESRLANYVTDSSTVQFLLKNLYWKEPGVLDWRFNLQEIYEKRERLMEALPQEKVDATVLFLTGGKSHYVPGSDHESILEMAPHACFLSMENAGHWLHADQPEPFMQHCLDFFMS